MFQKYLPYACESYTDTIYTRIYCIHSHIYDIKFVIYTKHSRPTFSIFSKCLTPDGHAFTYIFNVIITVRNARRNTAVFIVYFNYVIVYNENFVCSTNLMILQQPLYYII